MEYQKRARAVIPGGCQLLSKRPEMFAPGQWPGFYSRAKGAEVWDLDGNRYIDMSISGIGANILGFADSDVDAAVKDAITKGNSCSLNCPEDVELAELLCNMHPWAEMVRYARSGGESAAIAVRIARARMQKDMILFCGYHGWHDWYLSSNLSDDQSLDGHLLPGLAPQGVPRGLKGTSLPFAYNDTQGFLKLAEKYQGQIAAVVMEPVRNHLPQEGFLETVREVTEQNRILLVFDEISSGWRHCLGGAHLKFNILPDMAIFAKAISNGYPMAAIIGKRDVMQAAQDTFISSTYWTERIGPAAALATINKLKRYDVPAHLNKVGEAVQSCWKNMAMKHQLDIAVTGTFPMSYFSFQNDSLEAKTLFTQEMLEQGYLATTRFYASFAHSDEHISGYAQALDLAFAKIAMAIRDMKLKECLKGPVCHAGFQRLA